MICFYVKKGSSILKFLWKPLQKHLENMTKLVGQQQIFGPYSNKHVMHWLTPQIFRQLVCDINNLYEPILLRLKGYYENLLLAFPDPPMLDKTFSQMVK